MPAEAARALGLPTVMCKERRGPAFGGTRVLRSGSFFAGIGAQIGVTREEREEEMRRDGYGNWMDKNVKARYARAMPVVVPSSAAQMRAKLRRSRIEHSVGGSSDLGGQQSGSKRARPPLRLSIGGVALPRHMTMFNALRLYGRGDAIVPYEHDDDDDDDDGSDDDGSDDNGDSDGKGVYVYQGVEYTSRAAVRKVREEARRRKKEKEKEKVLTMWDQAFPLTFMIDGNATDRQLARRWGAVMLPPPPPKIGDVFAASGVFRVAFAAPLLDSSSAQLPPSDAPSAPASPPTSAPTDAFVAPSAAKAPTPPS